MPRAKGEYYFYVKSQKDENDRLNAFRKEIVDEAKKDELLQKMQKVIIKFRQKLKENYDIYKKLPPQIKDQLEYENFKSGKINPNMIIDFETYKFSSGKERRCPIEDRREIDEYYSS